MSTQIIAYRCNDRRTVSVSLSEMASEFMSGMIPDYGTASGIACAQLRRCCSINGDACARDVQADPIEDNTGRISGRLNVYEHVARECDDGITGIRVEVLRREAQADIVVSGDDGSWGQEGACKQQHQQH